jgi:hypothetical protein
MKTECLKKRRRVNTRPIARRSNKNVETMYTMYKRREDKKASSLMRTGTSLVGSAGRTAVNVGSSVGRNAPGLVRRVGTQSAAASRLAAKYSSKVGSKLGSGAKRVGKMAMNNPQLAIMAAGMGYTAYQAYNKDKELDEEEKKCYNVCYPKDWTNYKDGEISKPTYQNETSEGQTFISEGGDGSLFCTPENTVAINIPSTDSDHCDKYCGVVCDQGGVFENLIQDALGGALDTLRELPGFGPIIDAFEKYAVYIVGFFLLLVLYKVLSMFGLFNRRRNNNN